MSLSLLNNILNTTVNKDNKKRYTLKKCDTLITLGKLDEAYKSLRKKVEKSEEVVAKSPEVFDHKNTAEWDGHAIFGGKKLDASQGVLVQSQITAMQHRKHNVIHDLPIAPVI